MEFRRRMLAPKKAAAVSAEKVALYDKLIATRPEIERKGAANPYTAEYRLREELKRLLLISLHEDFAHGG